MLEGRWTPAKVDDAYRQLGKLAELRLGRATLERPGARPNIEIQGGGPWVQIRCMPAEALLAVFDDQIALTMNRLDELGVDHRPPEPEPA